MEVQVRWHGYIRGGAAEDTGRRERQAEEDAGKHGDQRCAVKKVVKLAQRKEVVKHWVSESWLIERRACQAAGTSRTGFRYRCQRPERDKEM